MKITKRQAVIGAASTVLATSLLGRPGLAADKPIIAFVVNVPADFWVIARRGLEKAAAELPNYDVRMFVPGEMSAAAQKQILQDLLALNVAGVTISPVNPDNSTDILNQVAEKAALFTVDGDAPNSNRIMYIGTDNVDAGREHGKLILKALPDGGRIMLFVGTMEAANAQERVQGIKEVLEGSKVEIVDIRTDSGDQAKARANVEDTLTKYGSDIQLLSGLWAYNTPQIYNAVKGAGREGTIKIVGFDEDQLTLRGISEGVIEATVVQQPYEFGYQSVKALARYIEGDRSMVPANKMQIVPTKIIDQSNVEEFASSVREMLRQ
ncbi:MAG TPA: sugar-binding protein [Geminicoccus sp.]|uniref:sugar-binding protein n=1 Tax=Geminicoccus sp. TaxID=2024832 RepID=UPI002BEE327B|nr:sugar-binding protein [Geminicoccus sp.]HWL72213.1 sugar-binding protein [Geminicoccus sp.]